MFIEAKYHLREKGLDLIGNGRRCQNTSVKKIEEFALTHLKIIS